MSLLNRAVADESEILAEEDNRLRELQINAKSEQAIQSRQKRKVRHSRSGETFAASQMFMEYSELDCSNLQAEPLWTLVERLAGSDTVAHDIHSYIPTCRLLSLPWLSSFPATPIALMVISDSTLLLNGTWQQQVPDAARCFKSALEVLLLRYLFEAFGRSIVPCFLAHRRRSKTQPSQPA